MSRIARLSALFSLLAALGCVGGLPTTHYYTLRAPASDPLPTAAADLDRGLAVGVESFAVDPPYDQDRLVYRTARDATEVGLYAYHRWAAPLGRLVAVAIGEGLRGTPGIRSIEPASSVGDYSARLGGRVIYLEELDLPDTREARVRLELVLRDREGETIWTETLDAVSTGNAESGAEVMEQVSRAFESLVTEARRSLATALAERASSDS